MTDISSTYQVDWSDPALTHRLVRRHRKDRHLRLTGLAALGAACLALAVLVGSLIYSGYPAFTQTHVTLSFEVSADRVPIDAPGTGNFRAIARDALIDRFPEVTSRKDQRALAKILSNGAQYILRDRVDADPELIGRAVTLMVPVSDPYDQLAKGQIDPKTPEANRRLDDAEINWFRSLQAEGIVSRPLNTGLLTNADSRFPELAGLAGALRGTFYALLVCFLISFPVGIGAGIYLEEFAPKNRFTDVVPAPLGAAGGRDDTGPDDPADDHHRHPRRSKGGAALDPRRSPQPWRFAASGRARPCGSAGDAGDPDRNHHRAGPGTG
jgi:phosphate transport system permease protein